MRDQFKIIEAIRKGILVLLDCISYPHNIYLNSFYLTGPCLKQQFWVLLKNR